MNFIHANFLHATSLKNTIVVFLITLFILSGCSSKYDNKITEVFRSNIVGDTKMFSFSLVFVYKTTAQDDNNDDSNEVKSHKQAKERGKGKRGDKGGERPNKQELKSSNKSNKRDNQMTNELETRLVEKLEENGYCRKGFFELKRTLSKSIYTIHGECNESATPADRKNFINKTDR
ncbi:hypothetical protein [Colwellia sp. 20A7]|uniref:hypothetical protein n=1 Tax=Colwellia sp. 20A7 TaxID=2689569 RepID=UPI0013578271|nr:hypothetical protein [Colwellia sp. 20A7]